MRNCVEWVGAVSAITSIGAICVPLNAWWTEDELDYALEDCGAKVLIADRERVERSATSRARLGIVTVAVRSAGLEQLDVDHWEDVVLLGAPMPDVVVDPEADATILYTSGTTRHPKGAVATHRGVV